MKQKIILVNNVQTAGNPALWFIYNQLKERFDVTISGYDDFEQKDGGVVNYKIHSIFYRIFLRLKRIKIFEKLYDLFSKFFILLKIGENNEVIDYKVKLFLLRAEFTFKNRKYDFVINVDTEASYISSALSKKNIPTGYYIYEIFAEQGFVQKTKPLYNLKTKLEKEGLQNSTIVFSSANSVIGEFLLKQHNIKRKIVELTICPPKCFSGDITISNPLKLYYHGLYLNGRGLDNLIIAMTNIKGATLFLRGKGYFEKELRSIVQQYNLDDKVKFLEPVDTEELAKAGVEFDLGLTMARMNVLNHIYAVGFKTFENISSGLALILPGSHPLKKLNEDYNLGIVYEDASVENLENVISYCVKNPQIVYDWKLNAREAYSNQFNPEKQRVQLINELETLLN